MWFFFLFFSLAASAVIEPDTRGVEERARLESEVVEWRTKYEDLKREAASATSQVSQAPVAACRCSAILLLEGRRREGESCVDSPLTTSQPPPLDPFFFFFCLGQIEGLHSKAAALQEMIENMKTSHADQVRHKGASCAVLCCVAERSETKGRGEACVGLHSVHLCACVCVCVCVAEDFIFKLTKTMQDKDDLYRDLLDER